MNQSIPPVPPARSVTLSDVAERAGVSLNTVSRVLRGEAATKYAKSKQKAKRIQRIADEMGYRVNTAARATASGRFEAIGLLFRDDGSKIGKQMVYGINDLLREKGKRLLLSPIHREREVDNTHVILRDLSVDGLLINLMQDVPEEFRQTVEQRHLPVIWLNAKLEQDCVRPDDYKIVESMTEHLLHRGHRRIAYLSSGSTRSGHYSWADREAGYRAAIRGAGLAEQCVSPDDVERTDHKRAAADHLLNLSLRPTAVVCGDEGQASRLLYSAALRGVSVPDELSVMSVLDGVGDIFDAELTGTVLPFRRIGEVAAMMLEQRIATSQHQPAQVLAADLRPGRTVASYIP